MIDAPFTDRDVLDLIVIGICLVAMAFFAAADAALSSFSRPRAKQILDIEGHPRRPLNLWIDHPTRAQSTILVYSNVARIIAAIFAAMVFLRHMEHQAVGYAAFVITVLVLVIGEIVPRAAAKAHQENVAVPLLTGVYMFYVLLYPIVWGFSELAEKILKLLGGDNSDSPPITEEELEFLVNAGEEAGVLEETKREMIVSALEFDETKVREIMTPRPDIKFMYTDSTYDEALNLAIESGLSRLPVCDENGIDHVVGILLVKDMLRVARAGQVAVKNFNIKKIMREAFFVPESKPIADVFKDLKSSKNHIAIVIDEHGGTAGLVTMEDILEEIVGEIQDEYDREEAEILELEAGIYDVSGAYNIDEFLEFFDIEETSLPEKPDEDVDTIAGYITHLLGDIPEMGKTVRIGPLNVEVADVQRRRLRRVRVSRILDTGEGAEMRD